MYSVEIESQYEEFWRYNMMVMCVGTNELGEQIFVESGSDCVAQIGDELRSKPNNYPEHRVLCVQTPPSSRLQLLAYVIPHTLPVSGDVELAAPFELSIKVIVKGNIVYSSTESVDQWSGASINIGDLNL